MKALYRAEDNAMNYLIIRDFDKLDEDTAVVNRDLSEEEIQEAVKAFTVDENDESFFADDAPEWKEFAEIIAFMNRFEILA